jgi:OOP family OmpA-OmpF porin
VERHHELSFIPAGKQQPVALTDGEIMVGVDIVSAKAVEINMVTVKASDMADALATKGTVDLYGILFDIDKTDIKPESAKTLDEVASLMKIDRSLKLEISGHTDNTGDKDHNQKLSEGRAQAVVDALVKNYGIDASRLAAKGYGDTMPVADNATDAGKAKNRRVELKKI